MVHLPHQRGQALLFGQERYGNRNLPGRRLARRARGTGTVVAVGTRGAWTLIAGIALGRAAAVAPITTVAAAGIGIALRAIVVFPRRLTRPLGYKVQIKDDVFGIIPLFLLLCFIFHGDTHTFMYSIYNATPV